MTTRLLGTRMGKPWLGRYTVDLLFEPRDAWVGAFWTSNEAARFLYVCAVPFFPLRFVTSLSAAERNER